MVWKKNVKVLKIHDRLKNRKKQKLKQRTAPVINWIEENRRPNRKSATKNSNSKLKSKLQKKTIYKTEFYFVDIS